MIPLVIIAGPTASGKTALSVELAKRLNGEIVSADSMQIYKFMNIGTAKPSQEERQGIVHHLMDIVDPWENFSLADYAEMAHKVIADIYGRGKLPIMVGGTGLYIDTVAENITLGEVQGDAEVRRELEEFAANCGNEALHLMLKSCDPESFERLHINDTKRIVRALEVFRVTGKTIGEHNRESRKAPAIYKPIRFMIGWDREVLYDRINRRVDIMLEQGLLQEVKTCLEMGLNSKNTAMQAIGYKELAEHLRGEISLEEAVEKIKMESRRYAKRQISWFKRSSFNILDPGEAPVDKAEEIIRGELK